MNGFIYIIFDNERSRDFGHKKTLHFLNAFLAKDSGHRITKSEENQFYKSEIGYCFYGTMDECFHFHTSLINFIYLFDFQLRSYQFDPTKSID